MSKIDRDGLSPRFWETKHMEDMNRPEWEALCDGCGKCCLNKLEDEDTGDVALTRVACRLLDDATCLCSNYRDRHQYVKECIVLTPENITDHLYWLPQTCAYRLVYQGEALFDWHPLISGDPETVHRAGVSLRGQTIPEFDVDEDDWEDHIIEEPS
ncbi:YcgN family cysteine cluster protein [Yoonia sp.]|uniref:YcgN family cysteine cluster protein n=1 Tax=Yoonia sp. TaxID=2212373 RepID=UPI003F6B046D